MLNSLDRFAVGYNPWAQPHVLSSLNLLEKEQSEIHASFFWLIKLFINQ
jgi:hypothetical protein